MTPLLTIAFIALLYHLFPVMRKDMYFGVRVAPAYVKSPEGHAILNRYRLINLLFGATGGALMFWGINNREGWAVVSGPLLYSIGMLSAIWHARRTVLPHAVEPTPMRTAPLASAALVPGWSIPLWFLPAVILAGTAWYLAAHWADIPDRFPVHWGLSGQADRWAAKTFTNVYRVLIIGASTLFMIYSTLIAILFGARRGNETRILRACLTSMLGIAITVSLLLATIALQPLAANPEKMPILGVVLAILPLVLISISILPIWRASDEALESTDTTPDECWHAGAYYYNPNDSALLVRNRMGMGYSPNFGHRTVQIVAPLLLLQLVATIFYVTR